MMWCFSGMTGMVAALIAAMLLGGLAVPSAAAVVLPPDYADAGSLPPCSLPATSLIGAKSGRWPRASVMVS